MHQHSIKCKAILSNSLFLFHQRKSNWLLDNICKGISLNELNSFLNEKDNAMQSLDYIEEYSSSNDKENSKNNDDCLKKKHYYRYNCNVIIVSNRTEYPEN